MKKITIAALLALLALICLTAIAAAATSDSGAVTFTVLPTQSLTANAISLGNVSSGTNDSTAAPVTVSSNTAWKAMAVADDDFTSTGPSIPAGNLSLGGTALSTTTPVQIATGSAGSGLSPVVDTSLEVPWALDPGAGLAFAGSITYTVTVN